MEKTAIVYSSLHHGNTLKLVKAIAANFSVDLIDAAQISYFDLTEYSLIGFASGISFGKFYTKVEEFLELNLPEGKSVFFIYTCAKNNNHFTESISQKAAEKKAVIKGEYGCRGYNTYGPLKIIGGMNKEHPTDKEIKEAVNFFESLL